MSSTGSRISHPKQLAEAAVFVASGVLLSVVTLLVEGISESVVVGSVIGAAILLTGLLFGMPRMRKLAGERSRRASRDSAGVARAAFVSIAWASLAIAICIGLAYLFQRLSRAANFEVNLGVVVILVSAAALIYAGVLLWVYGERA